MGKKRNIVIIVNDKMQKNYHYTRTEQPGKNFDPRFKPELTPKQMLKLGSIGVNSSESLSVWRGKGWIYPQDPRGWFQWYCRYTMGRRIPEEDDRQIMRWLAIKRHIVQIRKNCRPGDRNCRRRQRQAVLHWAYDSRKI